MSKVLEHASIGLSKNDGHVVAIKAAACLKSTVKPISPGARIVCGTVRLLCCRRLQFQRNETFSSK
ncbi:uncharacterized protein PHALS_14902 [Plasmopara halstedii]|uniref:Uncharacterized protein n=1 Tax=Plasmopara halstedii TaxID=4781 RepID=A0A0P1B070_PLAHL|nr:uncharacterized protein PHALS_14902 [Plasmopara halstedii]CEG46557.1 hypothetical protein PHALS_14902 [Plasmopara halstedii]|eukprot:XP_024582926.1 hypothetical protein PHALS_14902 [Plasmopara halstedii]